MAKPDTLCKLSKGKIIDSADGFVDTFNWLVDFCSNLKGDKEQQEDGHIEVDRSVDDYCVIRFSGEVGDGGDIKLVSGPDSNLVFKELSDDEKSQRSELSGYTGKVIQVDCYYL